MPVGPGRWDGGAGLGGVAGVSGGRCRPRRGGGPRAGGWGGRRRPEVVFPLRYLPGWLMGVEVNRLRPELRDRVLAYKREIAQLGWLAFRDRLLPPEVRRWITAPKT